MRHEFTDKQITTAANKSLFHYGEYNSERGYSWSMTAESLRSFLDALPDPQGDWQECGVEDIRKGDRVKVVDTHEAGDQTVYEGDVVQVSKGLVMTAHHQLRSVYNSKWYRIPAPVVAPDPAEHQFIRVDGKDYEAIPESGRYKLLGPGLATVHVINRENITEWTELELVPKEVADDDR